MNEESNIEYIDDRKLKKISDKQTAHNFKENQIEYDGKSLGFREIYSEIHDCSSVKALLQNLVEELPQLNKQVVYLRFWSNMNLDEIGYELNLRRTKVNKVLNESLCTIRKKLVSELYEEVSEVA